MSLSLSLSPFLLPSSSPSPPLRAFGQAARRPLRAHGGRYRPHGQGSRVCASIWHPVQPQRHVAGRRRSRLALRAHPAPSSPIRLLALQRFLSPSALCLSSSHDPTVALLPPLHPDLLVFGRIFFTSLYSLSSLSLSFSVSPSLARALAHSLRWPAVR